MSNKPAMRKALSIFYSYAHEDEKYTQKLIKHLSILRQNGMIKEWYDRDIVAGGDWEKEIDVNLQKADVIILLISAEFINSKYCWSVEMQAALKKDKKGTACVIPIIVKPVLWRFPPLSKFEALPKDAKPVVTWHPADNAWLNIAEYIKNIYDNGLQKKEPWQNREVAEVGLPAVRDKKKKTRLGKSKTSLKPSPIKKAFKATKKIEPRNYKELKRLIYDAQNSQELPGKVVRKEGDPKTRDTTVNEVYEWLGVCYQFFRDVYNRNSIDDKGSPLKATVHYGQKFANAFWVSNQIVCGDGDGHIFNKFPFSIEIVGKEFSMGLINHTKLVYWDQSGALYNSISMVFGCLIKQYYYHQKTDEADWLVGQGIFKNGNKSQALYSVANPGTAYKNNADLGSDRQPAHMNKYVKTKNSNEGIHINAGIPNRAFYLVAHALGGFAWEKAGRIWYESLMDKSLKKNSLFEDFARLNVRIADKLYGPNKEVDAVKAGWKAVGIDTDGKPALKKTKKEKATVPVKPAPKNQPRKKPKRRGKI
jgi:Thermolysin metallopeptidase, alpha-helical domain/Thermolysin metallopeptidase, catalytic domain/TIR domain